uniref:Zinc finger, CCHC-type n=1 Tax=Tanacetum cinerariifolium TaxID=118510 RepID=A0A6L2J2R4_TANCI|nr:zinc finger, CCHC-type [Tanacetum cinerariifolium]
MLSILIAKFDVEKFDESSDFWLCRAKMRCLLIQHGWEAALDPFPGTMTDVEKTAALKTDVYKKAHNHRDNQRRGSSRSKLKGKETYNLKCYICYFEERMSKKKSTGFVKKNAGQRSSMHYEGYDNGDLLTAVSEERFLKWIMNSGGSFHMTSRRDFLFDFKEFNGGMVLLGTMKGNYVYSLDGRAELGEASFGIQENKSLTQVWHKRMGHINEAGLHKFERRDVLGNKGLGKLEFYENYVLGKSTRVSIYNIGEEDTYGFIVRTSDTLKSASATDSGKEVEFEVELQGSRVEPTVDPHTGDEGNVSLYRPSRSKVDDMTTYAFAIAEEEDTHEPITFQEAINSSEKDEWVRAIKE